MTAGIRLRIRAEFAHQFMSIVQEFIPALLYEADESDPKKSRAEPKKTGSQAARKHTQPLIV